MSQEEVNQTETAAVNEQVPVIPEVKDDGKVGAITGQCKWFNDRYGYGFITITQGADKGKDIFVHHTGVKPLNSIYRTLKKGEYINFDVIDGDNGLQAVNVTGIGGGCLMCDVLPSTRSQQLTPGSQVAPVSTPPPPGGPRPGYQPGGGFGGRGTGGRSSGGGATGGRGGGRKPPVSH